MIDYFNTYNNNNTKIQKHKIITIITLLSLTIKHLIHFTGVYDWSLSKYNQITNIQKLHSINEQ